MAGEVPRLSRRLAGRHSTSAVSSSITLAELRYGADRTGARRLHALIDTFVATVSVAPFDATAADRFGPVAAALASSGTPLGGFDTLIAAHALALGRILVTHNAKHFGRVAGLRLENWV